MVFPHYQMRALHGPMFVAPKITKLMRSVRVSPAGLVEFPGQSSPLSRIEEQTIAADKKRAAPKSGLRTSAELCLAGTT